MKQRALILWLIAFTASALVYIFTDEPAIRWGAGILFLLCLAGYAVYWNMPEPK